MKPKLRHMPKVNGLLIFFNITLGLFKTSREESFSASFPSTETYISA